MEPSSDHNGGGDTVVQDLIDDARISRTEIGVVVENGAKVMDESSSDALISSVAPINSGIDASNEVNIGVGLLELEARTLTIERSSNHDGGGEIIFHPDAIDDARFYGDEKGTVMENVEKVVDEISSDAVVSSAPSSNSEIAACNGVNIEAGLLEMKSQTLTMELSSNHDDGGEIVVHQDSIDDAGLSGDERGNVMEDVNKVSDESRSDVVVLSVPISNSEIAASNGVTIGACLLEMESQTLTMESSSHHDGGGEVVHQDSVDDAGVSGDEQGNAMEDVEKVLDESRSDAAVLSVPTSNIDIAACNGVKTKAGLLESKTGSPTLEPASNHDGPGDNVFHQDSIDDARVSGDEKETIMEDAEKVLKESSSDDVVFHQDSIDDARVSGDEKETVMEDAEKVLKESSSDAVVSSVPLINSDIAASNGVNSRDDLLESKTETLAVEPSCSHEGGDDIVVQDSIHDAREPSCSHEGGDDIVVQDSIHDARVLVDEKKIVMENIEKVLDDNGVTVEEKEGKYEVTDLVWAKVRCYPWWPGQIFDPSVSTDNAKKYSNKKGFLVGYFGDQTFAWNEASKIKPFRKNFCKLEKQSNSKGFIRAVNCALDEVMRRVEFGLACPCLSKEVYAKIKSQVFVNAGIREEANKIDGGDRFSTVATFKPANIVHSVQDLAREHFDGFSRLEVLSLRAQLLAYNRWKGYNQFQAQNLIVGLINKLELPLMEQEKAVEEAKPASVDEKVSSKKRKLNSCDSGSRKHQHVSGSDSVPSKKQNRLTNVSLKGSMSESKGETKRKKVGGKKRTVEPNGFKEERGDRSADQKSSISPPKKLFRIGDTICKIAKQISESPSISKKESHKVKNNEKSVDQTKENIHGPETNSSRKSKTSKKNSATALILKFTTLDSIPSVTKLNEIFSRYGSVRETETELLKKNNCAKVVFEEQSNAEKAFSSAGKFSIFGPSLISYRLDYSPTSRKTPKKDGKSVDVVQPEE